MTAPSQIQVLITPLVRDGVYGSTLDVTQDIDVSDLVRQGGLGNLKRQLDFGDFDVGVYVFGDITLKCINFSGKFNDSHDWRSIFPYRRDLAKVEIKFIDIDGNTYSRFKGLVNDDATKQDYAKGETSMRVLSLDSVFRKTKVTGGAIASTQLFSTAIKAILNVPEITTVLSYDAANINVDYDGQIDVGSYFDDVTVKAALDELLLASNSILLINGNDEIIVKARGENSTIHNLYGNDNVEGRDNILNITKLNNGIQRAFNSIKVNESVVEDEAWEIEYGVRQKDFTLDFVTNTETQEAIGSALLAEFKIPKPEMELVLDARVGAEIDLLDKVSVNFDYRYTPADGEQALSFVGVMQVGDKVNNINGNLRIHENQVWKVIGIEERPKQMQVIVKLREIGTTTNDGWQ